MKREELGRLPIKTIKTYCQMYGYNITGLFEKGEIEEYISSRIVGQVELERYRLNMIARLQTITIPKRPSDFMDDFVHNLFGSSSEGSKKEYEWMVQTVELFFKDSVSRNDRPTPPPFQQQTNRNGSAQNAPQSTLVPVSIENIIERDINPSTLSIKQLRTILLLERISLQNLMEKQELVERVVMLVRNRRVELDVIKKAEENEKLAKTTESGGNDDVDALLCKICLTEPTNCVFLECGHLVCCLECGTQIFKTKKECPICRQTITRIVHTFRV
jgi:hypothetical protein